MTANSLLGCSDPAGQREVTREARVKKSSLGAPFRNVIGQGLVQFFCGSTLSCVTLNIIGSACDSYVQSWSAVGFSGTSLLFVLEILLVFSSCDAR